MDQRVAGVWVKALESGEYTQAAGYLHHSNTNSYCCLGVLCDLYIKEMGMELGVIIPDISEHGTNCMPEDRVLNWAGLTGSLASKYAEMNDDGASFNDIAKHIKTDAEIDA
jgi:hypothetical protein